MADFHVHIPYHKIAEHLSFIRQEKLNLELYIESNALDLISREDISQLKNQLDYNPSLTIPNNSCSVYGFISGRS